MVRRYACQQLRSLVRSVPVPEAALIVVEVTGAGTVEGTANGLPVAPCAGGSGPDGTPLEQVRRHRQLYRRRRAKRGVNVAALVVFLQPAVELRQVAREPAAGHAADRPCARALGRRPYALRSQAPVQRPRHL